MAVGAIPPLLTFEEAYFERIWGGQRLKELFGKDMPVQTSIGEAWLISDHDQHESVVSEGPLKGQTLRALLDSHPREILGARPKLTPHGRFPLLLKLLDANQVLSVQVHPDDTCAEALGEPDVGKTEMWHVLHADAGSKLICGLQPAVDKDAFKDAIEANKLEGLLINFPVEPGDSVFVPAGTVHAIGAGVVVAEIQQNSDITYRIYDFGRLGPDGNPRTLHIEQALEATRFGSAHGGKARPLPIEWDGAERKFLAACSHFASELVHTGHGYTRETGHESFHILLVKDGTLTVSAGEAGVELKPGDAVLVTGVAERFRVEGSGAFLDYYPPDLAHDVVQPLLDAGHSREAIRRLGGSQAASDLTQVL